MSLAEISATQLSRLIGLPHAPVIVDVRSEEDYRADSRLIPASLRREFRTVASWAAGLSGKAVAIIGQKGLTLSQGVAAWLRHEGIAAETLEGGFEAWQAAGQPLLYAGKLPQRDAQGRTVWVTRARQKSTASPARG